ncbi:hypothetical protein pipiens_014531 [Culex pipiens pipiens]|uniref:Cytochrome P450 n=1 Tax=Culex pipiens pipiens TaxID=38569 RepID=A0ABD1CU64_CULPP
MVLLLLTTIISVLTGVLYWLHRKQYKFADRWPSVYPAYPLIGNTLKVVGMTDLQRTDLIKETFQECDRISKAWAGPKLLLLTSHPDLIQKILMSPDCLEKPFLYRFVGIRAGIVHFKVLNLCEDGETIDIHKYTGLTFLEAACETTLGVDGLDRPGKKEFKEGLDKIQEVASKRMITPYLYPDVIYRMTNYFKEVSEASKIVCDFLLKLSKERKQFLVSSDNDSDDTEEENDSSRKPKVFVDEILKEFNDGKVFDDTELTHNMYAIITGAIDTSGTITAHACLLMSFYPDMQNRLFEEISELYPLDNPAMDFSPEMLKQLRYTEMFLNEILRYWPAGPMVARQNIAEIELDGVRVPPGQTFVMSIEALHRRKDVWGPDADRFDPENFSEERVRQRHSFGFLPFSGGKRICFGWRYAQTAMKVMMVHLVRNFQFSTKIKPEDVRFRHDVTMKLAFEHAVQITKRNSVN